MPFLIFGRDHLRSNMGIISGPASFAVQFRDHLRSGINCGPGMICGPVQCCFPEIFSVSKFYCPTFESLYGTSLFVYLSSWTFPYDLHKKKYKICCENTPHLANSLWNAYN